MACLLSIRPKVSCGAKRWSRESLLASNALSSLTGHSVSGSVNSWRVANTQEIPPETCLGSERPWVAEVTGSTAARWVNQLGADGESLWFARPLCVKVGLCRMQSRGQHLILVCMPFAQLGAPNSNIKEPEICMFYRSLSCIFYPSCKNALFISLNVGRCNRVKGEIPLLL